MLLPNNGTTRSFGHTVLVVDDSDDCRNLCRRTLQWAGYKVIEASGSQDALRIVEERSNEIDVVLIDYILPPVFHPEEMHTSSLGVRGDNLAKRIIEMHPFVRCILMSSYSAGQITSGALGLPFIKKPFKVLELLKIIGGQTAKCYARRIPYTWGSRSQTWQPPLLSETGSF